MIRNRIPLLVVVAMMMAYSVYFSALSIQRHNTFRTYASDMGQMDQAMWNTLHGNWLQDTRQNGQNLPRLTDHTEPIFFVVPLVFLVYDGIESLFVLQSIAMALAALPIFWIARRRLKSDWAGIAFAAMYLMFPAIQASNLAEFHAVTFAPAPLMLAYNYGEERAWKRFAFFALMALGVKEDMALLVFTLAGFFAVRDVFQASSFKLLKPETWDLKRINRSAAFIAVLSLVWFAIALFIIIPHFSPRNESVYIGRYPKTPLDMFLGLFIPAKIEYVLKLLTSVGFLALFDPLTLLVGSPSLVLNLLSSYDAQYSGTYHYSAPVAPYFVLAAIGGVARLLDWNRTQMNADKRGLFFLRSSAFVRVLIVSGFVIALGYHRIAGYTPIGGEYFYPEQTPHQQTLARFLKQIPANVPVSTTTTLFPHLSHRLKLYRFPTILDAEYILLDVSQSHITNPVDYRENYQRALDQGFGVRDALDGYILLQRGIAQKELPDGFYLFVSSCHCIMPQNSMTIDFDNKVRFLGYDVRQDDWQRVYLRTYWERLPGLDNNFALFPFFPDAAGNPRADAQLPPMLIHFWYPTLRWRADEMIIADTTPMEIGARAKIGVGVFFGATWDDNEFVLTPHTDAPISPDGRWVSLGELVRDGKKYFVQR